jgi:hypothetical protein
MEVMEARSAKLTQASVTFITYITFITPHQLNPDQYSSILLRCVAFGSRPRPAR